MMRYSIRYVHLGEQLFVASCSENCQPVIPRKNEDVEIAGKNYFVESVGHTVLSDVHVITIQLC